ncbi:MAG: cyclophilin-like fold protein [Candidatus Caldatribacteriota bacterium]
MRKIKLIVDNIELEAELNNSKTADKIWELLPIEGRVNTWGEEIYFSIGEKIELEKDANEVVSLGDLGYWPPGQAFCIFFGMTPVSYGNQIRAASPVNIFGKIIGDPKTFQQVKTGAKINIKKVE